MERDAGKYVSFERPSQGSWCRKRRVCALVVIVGPLFTQLIPVKMDQVDPLGWCWLVAFSVGPF